MLPPHCREEVWPKTAKETGHTLSQMPALLEATQRMKRKTHEDLKNQEESQRSQQSALVPKVRRTVRCARRLQNKAVFASTIVASCGSTRAADVASIAIHLHQNGEMPVDAHWNNLLDTLLHTLEQHEETQRQRHQTNAIESSEDKKGKLTIISANIHSLRPRANVIPTWEADVVALQETKLIAETSAVLRQNGFAVVHGRPCQPQTYRNDVVTTQAANEANSGGVAIVTKQGLKTITRSVQEQELELYDTSRWMETKILVSGRTKHITVASFHGISGSASNEKKKSYK